MLADKYARADRLKAAIKAAGFTTLKQAAERHHFTESTLTHHANGTRAFDIETGYLYAKTFKVDPAWLLGISDANEVPEVPTASQLEEMIKLAHGELEVGVSIAAYPGAVATNLHAQLVQFLAAGGLQESEERGTSDGKASQSPAPTKPGAAA